MRMLNPVHPGDFIRTEIIAPLGLTVDAAAKVLGVSRPTLSKLLNGRADLSGDMALRIEKGFGTWAREFRPIYGPFEAGLGRFVAFEKGEFVGRAAAADGKTSCVAGGR